MKHLLIYSLLTIFLVSCSTTKSRYELSTLGKIYHNTTARYNGYYNATVLLDESILRLESQHQDNYNNLLPLYPYMASANPESVAQDLDEAIKKVSVVVTLHEQSQWSDDCYLLIGQAYYLKRKYEDAENAFEFFLDEFNPSGTRVNAKPSRKVAQAKKNSAKKRRTNSAQKHRTAPRDDDKADDDRAAKTKKQLEKERKAYNKEIRKKRKQAEKDAKRRKKGKKVKKLKSPEATGALTPGDNKKETEAAVKEQPKSEPKNTEDSKKEDSKKDNTDSKENPGGIKHKPAYQDAVLWLGRTYVKRENYIRAEYYFSLLENNASLQKDVYEALPVAFAELYITREMYGKAIPYLEQAIDRAPSKILKARYSYILAQVHALNNNFQNALHAYENVIDLKPDYVMEFNARLQALNMGMLTGTKSEDAMISALEKMLRDEKNTEYTDQVYFLLGKLAYEKGDIPEAIDYLTQAANAGQNNPLQLAETQYLLGQIYFDREDYINAKSSYDASLQAMNKEDERYDPTKKLAANLTDIARHLQTIALQDSLIRISNMSDSEKKALARQLQKEKEEAQAVAAAGYAQNATAQMKSVSDANNNNSRQSFTPGASSKDPLAGANLARTVNTSGNLQSSFFAYDSKAVKRGQKEFDKTWGSRPLVDNWRLSSIASSSLSFDDERQDDGEIQAEIIPEAVVENLFKDVPATDIQRESAHKKIQDAMLALGQLYREKLEDYQASVEVLEELLEKYPETEHKLEAYYQLYVSYTIMKNASKIAYYKERILEEYSQSKYAQVILDPDYLKKQKSEEQKISDTYDMAYREFAAGNVDRTLEMIEGSRQTYGTQHPLYPKYHLLFAMAIGQKEGKDRYVQALKEIIAQHPKTPEETKARDILLLLGETKDTRLTQGQDAEANFKVQKDALHFVVVLVTSPNKISMQDAKVSISDYHKKYNSIDNLRISSLIFNTDTKEYIVLVRSFDNQASSMQYYANFLKNRKEYLPAGVEFEVFPITQHNYREVIKMRSIEPYMPFFKDNY